MKRVLVRCPCQRAALTRSRTDGDGPMCYYYYPTYYYTYYWSYSYYYFWWY